ncbi:5-formyltetrahydrofolate cyclo-ligase [Candidatus Woesearchaeota archaeon]|nr:5-formyltetrahydrofolate cyclo-ligase [Candidatus Woesearchaeota archaeon]
MTLKKELRKKARDSRDDIEEDEILSLSRDIKNNLFSLEEISKNSVINCYASFQSEVYTFGMIHDILEIGKTLTLPKTKNKDLELYNISHKDIKRLKQSRWGIYEPLGDTRTLDVKEHDVVIAPGIAFDLKGNRLGYGAGFYDRLFSKSKRTLKIALAFERQLIEKVPSEKHDIKLDMIITEKDCYNIKKEK